ncbi:hypothetical protein H696_01569 [Fonticula alba]|uniref:Pre-mRNA-processing factor 17 n=1 Tax=Fonticula alba TaxID=691883 RepID=A0A058ZFB0_FONAL|nr:hypothetical protein H696_01569 [Fonticula alba]KCV72167.1 hypothetical protein H696_01569 [Fonticula alba]|eukprot:XP_009493745.1 hypothetical protein H696_01569 [Fonticula alba]
MDLIQAYSSDDEQAHDSVPTTKRAQEQGVDGPASKRRAAEADAVTRPVNLTPAVAVAEAVADSLVAMRSINPTDHAPILALVAADPQGTSSTEIELAVNPNAKYAITPFGSTAAAAGGPAAATSTRNSFAGKISREATDLFQFERQRRSFLAHGFALTQAGSETVIVGDAAKALASGGVDATGRLNNKTDAASRPVRPKRKDRGDVFANPHAFEGPWAGYTGELVHIDAAEREAMVQKELEGVKPSYVPVQAPAAAAVGGAAPGAERTIFHGKAERDYQGRPWTSLPLDTGVDFTGEGPSSIYLPKKLIHTWSGHTDRINAIRLFPQSGHLLLSASNDSKVKIWQVYDDRRCMRTYLGHSKAVRDINFTADGRRFLSASFDRTVKIWDTETGACLSSYSSPKIPFCATFNPRNEDEFLVGSAEKRIVQYDSRLGKIVQEYDQHLDSVNTLTFVDEGRRFISTSDDKSIRVWDYNIPVVIKFIADPSLFSIAAVSVHPNRKWWAGQSLDNQIMVYSTRDRFQAHRSKTFRGHNVAGYACRPGFSPDGRYIMSGDAKGQLWFWDWKTSKSVKVLKCHNDTLIDCAWLPHETSKVVTCSWDSTIKLWD